MLHINLFGQASVTKDGQPVIINRRVTRALLFYIAAMPKPVSREALLDLFWPEKPFERARLSLADTLAKLRANLSDDKALLVTPGFISINRQVVEVDWSDFCDLKAKISQQPGAFQPNQSLSANVYQNMSALIQLWNNHELIASDEMGITSELEDWLSNLRLECIEFLIRVLRRLSQHETLAGNHDQAITWLEMAHRVSKNEYDDSLNAALLEAYLNAQRHAEAQALYLQLKTLYETGADGDLPGFFRELKPRLTLIQPGTSPFEYPSWNIQPGLPVPFIGQKAALAELTNRSKRGGGVIVIGDGGSGKTRLVYEFCRQNGAGMRMLVANCQPLETDMPFAPWVGLLRTSILEADWRKLNANWVAPLALLLPELQSIRPDVRLMQSKFSEITRTVLLEAIYQLLMTLAQKGNVILFLDDAHWADESSLALVSYLLKKSFFRPGHGLLILSARAEEKNPHLDEFLLSDHQEPLHRINTQMFSQEDLAALCYFVFSRQVPAQFLEKLFLDTGGNEYYCMQILQAFQKENPDPAFEHVESLPLPPSMTDAMQRKFSALSPAGRDVINTAAVLGSRFEIPMLESAVSYSPKEYLLALADLEQAHLIRPLRESNLAFGFVHEKLREMILFNVNQNHKRLLHRNIAAAMEKHLAASLDSHAALLAYHYEESGLYPQAFDAWLLAAQYDWKLMATQNAMEACQRAERLIRRTSELAEGQIYKMYGIWNQIAFENDDFKTLEALNLSLKTLGLERESDLLVGAALTGLSDAEMARNNFEKALEHAEQAMNYIQNTDSIYEKARVRERRGVYIYMLGRLSEAQPNFWQALELTRDAAEPLSLVVRGNTFYQLAITETLRGYPLSGLEHARQALATHQATGNNYGKIAAYSVMAAANFLVTDYVQGLENARLGIELADRVDGWRMNGYLCSYAGMCETELGMLGPAWEHAQKAIEIGRRQGHGEIVGMGMRVLGDLYLRLGAVQKANDIYQQGLAAAGQHFVALELMSAYGFTQLLLGLELGRQYLLHAVNTSLQSELGAIAMLGTILELSMYQLSDEQELFKTRAAWLREQVINRTGHDVAGYFTDRIVAEACFNRGDYLQAHTVALPCIAWYRDTQNCWAELSMLWVIEKSAQELGLRQASMQPRIHELLDMIENSINTAPLQNEWQVYRQKMPN